MKMIYKLLPLVVSFVAMCGCTYAPYERQVQRPIEKLSYNFYAEDLRALRYYYFPELGKDEEFTVTYIDSDLICWPTLKRSVPGRVIYSKLKYKGVFYKCKIECDRIKINVEKQVVSFIGDTKSASISWDKNSDLKYNFEQAQIIQYNYSRSDMTGQPSYSGNGPATASHASDYP